MRDLLPLGGPSERETLERYGWIGDVLAGRYFFDGADRDDVRQEALIGLLNGARTFEEGRGRPFRSWLWFCAEKQVQQAVTRHGRGKHRLLTDAATVTDDAWQTPILDTVADLRDELEGRRLVRDVLDAYQELSELEKRELAHVTNGGTYDDAGVRNKRRENAVDRARNKLRRAA